MADDRFRWHPSARLFGGAGDEWHQPVACPPEPAFGALDEGGESLTVALGFSAAGHAFRIGGGAEAPPAGACPMFETLTSGTSGQPRRIRRSQASWIESFTVNARMFGTGPGARVAVLGRLVHSLSLYGAIEALHLGAELHLLSDMRPDRQVAALATRGVTLLYATPAQLRLLAEAKAARALPSAQAMRFVLVGGSKLDPATRATVLECFPNAEIREFYGAAEASFITLADAKTPEAAVGRAYHGVHISVRNAANLPLEAGEIGEVWVQSPYLFDSYGDGTPGSARWHDGWLSVGEMGWLDAQSHLYLAGRQGRMVTIADQNVFPEEIEALLLTFPGISRAAVLARPDARRGHVLEAVVMGDIPDPEALLATCRRMLGPLKTLRRLHLRNDWPVLPSGKTDLATLQAELT